MFGVCCRYDSIDIERAKYSAKPIATQTGDVSFNITTLVPKLPSAPATPSASGTSTPLRTGSSTPLPPQFRTPGTSTPIPQYEPSEPELEERIESLSISEVVTRHLTRIKDSAQHFLG